MKRVLSTLGLLAATASLAFASGEPPAAVRDLIGNHCLKCHGPTTQKAGLRLDQLSGDLGDPATFRTWIKVHDRVQAGEMPPKARPDAKEAAAALTALAGP